MTILHVVWHWFHLTKNIGKDPKLSLSNYQSTIPLQITFESGNWLRVKDFRAYLNVEVQATSRDYGALEGICGTFDNNKRNEFISPNGMVFADSDIPVDFTRSWRIPTEQSLFTGQFQKIATSTSSRPVVQLKQCMCKMSSNLAECGTTKAIKDPNTSVWLMLFLLCWVPVSEIQEWR
ncbi:hypothetical protein SNE40_021236 [Patella caerulea]|uniref:VWFD domain-containing protein n=1 Tax=Patella caerulea TaxID=87958 RepID=A0AAN8G3K5_PATCE